MTGRDEARRSMSFDGLRWFIGVQEQPKARSDCYVCIHVLSVFLTLLSPEYRSEWLRGACITSLISPSAFL